MQIKKFPYISISTREEHRGSHHGSRRALFFSPHLEMRVYFTLSLGKESQHSRSTSSGGGLNLKFERNAMGRSTIPKDSIFQFTLDTTDFHALTRLSSRVLTHNTMASVTALWHRERSHRSQCQLDRNSGTTVIAQRKADLHVTT